MDRIKMMMIYAAELLFTLFLFVAMELVVMLLDIYINNAQYIFKFSIDNIQPVTIFNLLYAFIIGRFFGHWLKLMYGDEEQ